ncbi:1-deoxy-D-xylulose-5-phosphate reductoisomerase, partial [Xanthomonas perforans]
MAGSSLRQVAVFGATGSIGASALDVIARHPERLRASVLSAGSKVDELLALCATHRPAHAVIADAALYPALRDGLRALGLATQAHAGAEALDALASGDACDTVVAAIVGAAGLPSTLAAARAGKRLLLANKESLVLAGELLTRTAAAAGAEIIPIDSEHSAIFQCLRSCDASRGVRRVILTASGGPFRGRDRAALAAVTPAQAVAHPKWSMGPKISVDSATLMNKGLEVIEAHHLFGLPGEQIDVLV